MPSLKAIIEGGPISTIRFDWGGDEIVMRVHPQKVTAGDVEDAEISERDGEPSQIEMAQASQKFVADTRALIADCLVDWNMWMDDEETEMIRDAEQMRALPVPFLIRVRQEIMAKAEADARGEAGGASAAG